MFSRSSPILINCVLAALLESKVINEFMKKIKYQNNSTFQKVTIRTHSRHVTTLGKNLNTFANLSHTFAIV